MIKKKILLVFGTRPEAIKIGPLYNALKEKNDVFDVKVCLTSQHREMLDQVLNTFDIKADIDLNLMKKNQNLFDLTSSILSSMKKIFKEIDTDAVIVHGDTTTTFATSLAAFYSSVDIGHVEAGLRTNNLKSPFPEEFNRQMVSKIARWHFSPTESSKNNLLKEGVKKNNLFVTGNTVIDSLFWTISKIEKNKKLYESVINKISKELSFDWLNKKFILITAHRRENFGEGLLNICNSIKDLAHNYRDINFVYPVHPNPNVIKPVKNTLSNIGNVHLIKPLDYESFTYLMKHSYIILTDSGGIQEEAPSLGKPVLVMRDTTERPEAVIAGTVKLVGNKKNKIKKSVEVLLNDNRAYIKMSKAINPYGDGRACEKIIKALSSLN